MEMSTKLLLKSIIVATMWSNGFSGALRRGGGSPVVAALMVDTSARAGASIATAAPHTTAKIGYQQTKFGP